MRAVLIAPLLIVLLIPSNTYAFWGSLTQEEKSICRNRASRERNEFSAKQTYDYCIKNIKSEREEGRKRAKERAKKYNEICPPLKAELERIRAYKPETVSKIPLAKSDVFDPNTQLDLSGYDPLDAEDLERMFLQELRLNDEIMCFEENYD